MSTVRAAEILRTRENGIIVIQACYHNSQQYYMAFVSKNGILFRPLMSPNIVSTEREALMQVITSFHPNAQSIPLSAIGDWAIYRFFDDETHTARMSLTEPTDRMTTKFRISDLTTLKDHARWDPGVVVLYMLWSHHIKGVALSAETENIFAYGEYYFLIPENMPILHFPDGFSTGWNPSNPSTNTHSAFYWTHGHPPIQEEFLY